MSLEVYIGKIYGKSLFYSFDTDIKNGITFYTCKNLGQLIKQLANEEKITRIKITPKVCKYRSFIF